MQWSPKGEDHHGFLSESGIDQLFFGENEEGEGDDNYDVWECNANPIWSSILDAILQRIVSSESLQETSQIEAARRGSGCGDNCQRQTRQRCYSLRQICQGCEQHCYRKCRIIVIYSSRWSIYRPISWHWILVTKREPSIMTIKQPKSFRNRKISPKLR